FSRDWSSDVCSSDLGLCVAIAYHAGLFNIGGEGQATLGGLGVALALLYLPLGHWLPAMLAAILGAAAFGALWALVPAWLQARRSSEERRVGKEGRAR